MTLPGVLDLNSPVMKRAAMRYLLHALNVFLQVWVPDYGFVLQEGVDKGDVSLLFAGRWAALEISA